MYLYFTKMQGLGNDFVVIDLITQNVKFRIEHIQHIADRHLGIGCDQVILIEPPIHPSADFYYRIFNADGEEVEQCGNGARCAAQFFFHQHLTRRRTLQMDCLAGSSTAVLEKDNQVRMNMGVPKFDPKAIPCRVVEIENTPLEIQVVSMGNPHAIIDTEDLHLAPVDALGALLSRHTTFPNGTNVEFRQIVDRHHIRLRVFERGVGETLACGTGAAAAAAAGIRQGLLDSPVQVMFRHGELAISWADLNAPLYLTGPAVTVFMGRLCL